MGQGRAKDAAEGHPGAFNGVLIVHSQCRVRELPSEKQLKAMGNMLK